MQVTFRTTANIFFGINAVLLKEVDENLIIKSILGYFKAWEYCLLRPCDMYTAEISKHHESITDLKNWVCRLIRLASTDLAPDSFIGTLLSAEKSNQISRKMVEQCSLEMLLAGTDTSSVMMFYSSLALAEHHAIADSLNQALTWKRKQWVDNQFNREICTGFVFDFEGFYEDMLLASVQNLPEMTNFLNEVLRMKPVGPVVIRRAVESCVIRVPGLREGLFLEAGEGIVLHLEAMHRREDLFTNPNIFDPSRFDNKSVNDMSFFPFGYVPCIITGVRLHLIKWMF